MIYHKRFAIKFFLLFLLCMECNTGFVSGGESRATRCIEREREALLRFKQGLVDEHGVISSWGSEDHKKECCKWKGVRCSNTTGHVTTLLLHAGWSSDGNSLYRFGGKISSVLLELRSLNHLDLSWNDFGGIRIPEFFGSMKTLEHLYLLESNFSGIIPPQLGNLTNLRTLELSYNHIWSENLNWLSHLSLLSYLSLDLSNISDTNWLQHVLKLPSLQELHLRDCMLTNVRKSSAGFFVNSSFSKSHSVLELSSNELTSSTVDWLFNISSSLVRLDLSYNKLGGISKSLGNLSHLQDLNLSGNDLGEPLEELLGMLSCRQLVSLDLFDTQLTGSVPVSLGQFSRLRHLDISHNSLEGTISEAHFMNLLNLRWLGLSFNKLTLDLSPDWIPPFHLDAIHLASCKMGPSFPTWLPTQRNFTWLDLSSNGISDEVPKWFWNLFTRAFYFNLSHNQISGTIPNLSSQWIYVLDVSFNKFSGPLPLLHPETSVVQFSQNKFSGSISSICNTFSYIYLIWLDFSNNQLEGALPNCWGNTTELRILNLNNNNFSGEIPHSLGSLRNLKTLHLRDNNLSGELPSTLMNCRNLQLIDIGGNKISGNIPPWLGLNMAYLSLRGNRFDSDIPPEICGLTKIQMLDLSGNNIPGIIPQCFNNFTLLADKNRTSSTLIDFPSNADAYKDYALVQWKGQELEYRNTLGLLKLIDLSNNKLVGDVPKAFSSLRGLISLNLSRNSLTGNIDPDIGQIEMLECLDLSRNQLFGEIPIGLAQLHYLAVLDLANNNLSGKIPSSTQLQGFNASVYAGNGELCGRPLKLCPEDDLTPHNNNEGEDIKEKDYGFLSLSFMQEFGISMAFGFIIGFWGIVGSLLLKTSWRIAYFNVLDAVGDWWYVTTTIFLAKFRRS